MLFLAYCRLLVSRDAKTKVTREEKGGGEGGEGGERHHPLYPQSSLVLPGTIESKASQKLL